MAKLIVTVIAQAAIGTGKYSAFRQRLRTSHRAALVPSSFAAVEIEECRGSHASDLST
jgi:hypothetical protein